MSDHDALLAAICAEPDEDTPRLAYADWLEEHDQPERAAFVRAQIDLARTPAWEPFAVACRWRRPDLVTGKPFRHTLPAVDGFHVEWHPAAFRRGLGHRLNVRSLVAWEQTEARVLDRAPVGEMHLWAATLDDWLRFASSPVVSRLRALHLVNSPIEPLRVLRDRPEALGVADIHFERAGGAGIPFVVEELVASPLGRAVRGLHFRMGYESLDDLVDALAPAALERLSLRTMGLIPEHVGRLMAGRSAGSLRELDLRGNPLGYVGWDALFARLPAGVHTLGLAATGGGHGFDLLATCRTAASLRRLDVGGNPLTPRAARSLSRSPFLAGVRSLDVSRCRVGERELYHLTRSKFWPNLVELDLRGNPLSSPGIDHLLDAAVPGDLAALVFDGDQLGTDSRNRLQKKYGERVVLAAAEA